MQKLKTFALCVVLLPCWAFAADSTSADVSWIAPTANTDGSALTNLASYHVSYGKTSGGPYTLQTTVPATQLAVNIKPPSAGLWFFVVQAINSNGVESAFSAQGSKLIRLAAPTDGSLEAPTDGALETR